MCLHLHIDSVSNLYPREVHVLFQSDPLRVLVTGAAGQIAYSLLYSVAKGDVFGKNQVKASLSHDYG